MAKKLITHPISNETLCISQWANKLGLSKNSLLARLKKYPLETALSPYYLSNKGEPDTTKTIKERKAIAQAIEQTPIIPSFLIKYYESEILNFLELPIGKVSLTVRRYPKNTRISILVDGVKPLFMLWPKKYSNGYFDSNNKQIYDKIRAYLLSLKV